MRLEKKNKLLMLSLTSLVVLAIILALLDRSGSQIDKELFKVENLVAVDRVSFESRNSTVELVFNGAKWKVNGQYDADDQMITVLFATLEQVQPKRKVAKSQGEGLEQLAQSNGIEVKLSIGESLVRRFKVFGNERKSEAYFLNDDEAYVMNIPGYRVYVAGIFELDESGWRDKRIFNFNWRNFKRLVTQFKDRPASGFEVLDSGNGFQIANETATDTTKLNDYLDHVSLLVAQQIVDPADNVKYDSLAQLPPDATIDVYDLGDRSIRLGLYLPADGRSDVLAKWNEGDLVLLSRSQAFPLTQTREYFVKKVP